MANSGINSWNNYAFLLTTIARLSAITLLPAPVFFPVMGNIVAFNLLFLSLAAVQVILILRSFLIGIEACILAGYLVLIPVIH